MKHLRFENYSRSTVSAAIDEWIFNERDRAILKRRLLDGICYEPLAEEFGLSVDRIKQIVYKSQAKLFKHLRSKTKHKLPIIQLFAHRKRLDFCFIIVTEQ